MAKTSYMFLAFALLLALAFTSPKPSAYARLVDWNAPFEQIATPFNLSGDFVGPVLKVSAELSQEVAVGTSVVEPIKDKFAEKIEDGLDHKIWYEPGFDIINNVTGLSVEVQCYNADVPDPPMLFDYIIPVGGQQGWNLNDIDPTNVHVKYVCNFIETSAYRWKRMSYEVWTRTWDSNVQPFYCIHCFFMIANDGLYVRVQTHDPRKPHDDYIKLTTWLLSE